MLESQDLKALESKKISPPVLDRPLVDANAPLGFVERLQVMLGNVFVQVRANVKLAYETVRPWSEFSPGSLPSNQKAARTALRLVKDCLCTTRDLVAEQAGYQKAISRIENLTIDCIKDGNRAAIENILDELPESGGKRLFRALCLAIYEDDKRSMLNSGAGDFGDVAPMCQQLKYAVQELVPEKDRFNLSLSTQGI